MLNRRALLASAAAAAAASAAGCASTAGPAPGSSPVAGPVTSARNPQVTALLDQFAQEILDDSPELRTSLGNDTGPNAAAKGRLSDYSDAEAARQLAKNEDRLRRLNALPTDLTGPSRVDRDSIAYALGSNIALGRLRENTYVVSQLTGSYQSVPDFLDSQHTIETAADAEAYLSRLAQFPRALDQETERMQAYAAVGTVPPDFIIERTQTQMRALRGTPVADSTLVASLVRRTREKGLAGDWGARATRIVTGEVYPALDRQLAAVAALRPRATHDAGVWRLKDGPAFYAASLRDQTTTDLSPDQVHELGRDVARQLTERADGIFRGQGMTQGTVAQRIQAISKEPRFLYPNTDPAKEQLLRDLNAQIVAITARVSDQFNRTPKAAVEVRRVPKFIEAGAPGGYYNTPTLDGSRPGIYWINLRDTAELPKWSLPTLTYHEAVPGHHYQLALQLEQEGLPLLRKFQNFNAYTEGWALYSEQVADEIGMYEGDPYGEIGYLQAALFRAGRLVVDTGLHHKRWSRERAIREFVDITGDAETTLATEIERYCVWPGQACGYMVGKVEFLRLRDESKVKLGARFDVKGFHDAILLGGSMPMAVLDSVLDAWTAGQAA
jgi:uncharacterized protein (DUF885 family)